MPPTASCLRITQEAAGVESSPSRPTSTPAEAVGGGDLEGDLHQLLVEEASIPADHQGGAPVVRDAIDDRLHEVLDVVGLPEDRTFLRRPEVPGFWSG